MIHPDIRKASTLPSWFYFDQELYGQVLERVFSHSWQYAGDLDQVRAPGQVHPFTLLEGTLDVPLVLTRDDNDEVHCLSNVCTHRGNLVVNADGFNRHLTCRYHGRRFGLDGSFEFMPEMQEAVDFPRDCDSLRRFPTESFGKWLFTGLDPAMPFAELVADMQRRLGHLDFDAFKHEPTRSRDYFVQANWALYCDNYLEGFHIPYVHASLNEVIDYGSYRTELFPWGVLQIGYTAVQGEGFELPAGHPDEGHNVAGYYYWLWPNMMFNFYPWGLSINLVQPISVDRTRVSYIAYVADPDRLEYGAGAELDRVEREDEEIVEAVQRGIKSRYYQTGRYSPTREQGVHHFHRLYVQALGMEQG